MRRFVVLACALIVCGVDTRTQPSSDLALILASLAERTQRYYDRFISIICTETVQTQNLNLKLAPVGQPRMTVYELSVSRDSNEKRPVEFRVERTLQSVNGRPARKNQRTECTDPKTGTPEPLGFLLSKNQSRYRFNLSDAGGGPAGTQAIDFVETPPARVRVKWTRTVSKPKAADNKGGSGSIRIHTTSFRSMCGSRIPFSFHCQTDSSAFAPQSSGKIGNDSPVFTC